MRKSLLLVTVVAAAVVLTGVKTYALDAAQIEGGPINAYVTYDGNNGFASVGYDPNGYPVITAVGSSPSVINGRTYTGWAALAQDQSGSLDLFISSSNLTVFGVSSLAVGEGINSTGTYDPFHQLPELNYSTVASSNQSFAVASTGNISPGATVTTVHALNVGSTPENLAGYYVEVQNATISGGGSYSAVFPTTNNAYVMSDSSGSFTLYDYVTSYSDDGAFGGQAVPTGPVNIYGVVSVYGYGATASPEFIPFQITGVVPEPSALLLAGMGLLGLLALWRRRS